jgi:hypothetical protein
MHDGACCMAPTESWPFKDSQSPKIVIFEVVSDKILLELRGTQQNFMRFNGFQLGITAIGLTFSIKRVS